MLGLPSHPIVRRALALEKNHQDWATLQVLDAAMEGHTDTHPDFEIHVHAGFSDWLHPPSPFAELLRKAFGMHFEPADASADSDRWQEVIDAFAARYRLWR
jgi:hypothetical protein